MNASRFHIHCIQLVAAITATGFLGFSTIGPSAITRADSAFPESHSAADPQSVADYWTPERMRSARPPALRGKGNGVGRSPAKEPKEDKLKHRTGIVPSHQVARYPHTSIGKVFFTLDGFDHVCSASAVTSEGHWGEGSGQLVVTAGHCLNNGFGGFASNWTFVPGYFDGNAPLGTWSGRRLFTTNEWNGGFGSALGRDVGFAIVTGTGEYEGTKLHDVVDALDIGFTESHPEDGIDVQVDVTTGSKRAIFGYGVLNWGGESQVRTLSRIDRIDPNFSPPPLGAPSTHTGGSSGGPWMYNYAPTSNGHQRNIVTGVNSYVYGGVDRLYSPQFDGLIHQLWSFAATSGPTSQVTTRAVPEPSSLSLLGLGCVAIAARRRRRAFLRSSHSDINSSTLCCPL